MVDALCCGFVRIFSKSRPTVLAGRTPTAHTKCPLEFTHLIMLVWTTREDPSGLFFSASIGASRGSLIGKKVSRTGLSTQSPKLFYLPFFPIRYISIYRLQDLFQIRGKRSMGYLKNILYHMQYVGTIRRIICPITKVNFFLQSDFLKDVIRLRHSLSIIPRL